MHIILAPRCFSRAITTLKDQMMVDNSARGTNRFESEEGFWLMLRMTRPLLLFPLRHHLLSSLPLLIYHYHHKYPSLLRISALTLDPTLVISMTLIGLCPLAHFPYQFCRWQPFTPHKLLLTSFMSYHSPGPCPSTRPLSCLPFRVFTSSCSVWVNSAPW